MKPLACFLCLALFLNPMGAAPENQMSSPKLLEPSDGTVTCFGIPHFRWEALFAPSSAAMPSYTIQISRDRDFKQIVDKDTLAAVITRYVPDRELPPGEYWWRVAGIDAQDSQGPWSEAGHFRVQLPTRELRIPRGATFGEIQKILSDAAERTPAKVLFEKANYRLDPGRARAFIPFEDRTDLVIDGQGATITFTDFIEFVHLRGCRRILIKNFNFDFEPLPYTAGRVLTADGQKGQAEIEILPGHPLPESNPAFEKDHKGMVMDASYPRIKQGVRLVVPHEGFEKISGRKYRFLFKPQVLRSSLSPGDIYVLDPRQAPGFVVLGGDEIVFSQLVAYAVCNESFNSHYANRHSLLHCQLKRKEGRVLAANNGGNNHHNARIGPWIEGCLFENTGDDICHVNSLVTGIAAKTAPDRVRLFLHNAFDRYGPSVGLDMRPGDLLQFFNRQEGRLVSERRVLEIARQGKFLDVALDGEVGEIVPGRVGVTQVGLQKVPANRGATQVFNASRTCNQFVFRNNVCRNGRRIGVLAKGRGGLIEGNTFEGLGGGAIEFWNAPFEGLGAMDYVVRGNQVRDCCLLDRRHAAIWSMVFKSGRSRCHRNILIENNQISGCPGPAFLMHDVEGLTVRNNRVQLDTEAPKANVYDLSNTSDVRIEKRQVAEPPRPPIP